MESLPRELIIEFAKYLPANDINSLRLTNKYFYKLEKLEKLWLGKLDWRCISHKVGLPEPFIRKYDTYVKWETISLNQLLSEQFIIEYSDKVVWNFIFATHKLSDDFQQTYWHKVDFEKVHLIKELLSMISICDNIDN